MSEPSLEKLAYLAGFFDGEGTITGNRTGNGNALQLAVSQRDPRPLELFVETFGGSLYSLKATGTSRRAYRWMVSKPAACFLVLTALLPYLIVKQDEALVGLRFAEYLLEHHRHPINRNERNPFYDGLNDLKTREWEPLEVSDSA